MYDSSLGLYIFLLIKLSKSFLVLMLMNTRHHNTPNCFFILVEAGHLREWNETFTDLSNLLRSRLDHIGWHVSSHSIMSCSRLSVCTLRYASVASFGIFVISAAVLYSFAGSGVMQWLSSIGSQFKRASPSNCVLNFCPRCACNTWSYVRSQQMY